MAELTQSQIDALMSFLQTFDESEPGEHDGLLRVMKTSVDNIYTDVNTMLDLVENLDLDALYSKIASVQNHCKLFAAYQAAASFQHFVFILRALNLTDKSYDDDVPLKKLRLKISLKSYDSWDIAGEDFTINQSVSGVESDSSGVTTVIPFDYDFESENPLSFYCEYEVYVTYEERADFSNSPSEEALESDIKNSLGGLLSWLNSEFHFDDLVLGEPYSLPPANSELATQAMLGGLVSAATNQIVPVGTLALQLLEQYQAQKTNFALDTMFKLLIDVWKVLCGGGWPKGDFTDLTAAVGALETGLEYRAKVNDTWLNQSLVRALNSYTNESSYPLDAPSVSKVVAEKTDTYGVQYGNFKKVWPFQAASNDIFYTSEELRIVPWPKQLFFIQE